jgi:hypothetical protein
MLAVYVYSMRRLARDVSPSGEFTTWRRSTLAAYLTGVLVELCPRVTHVCIDTGTALEETVELGTFITALDAVEEGRLYER